MDKEDISENMLMKFKKKIDLSDKIYNYKLDDKIDVNKYSKYCNDLSFFEPSSDFLYNTKVYLPDPKKDKKSGCSNYIVKAIYDTQEYINKRQNNHGSKSNIIDNDESCSYLKYKLYYPPESEHGVGAQLTSMAYNLAQSISNNLKYVTPYITKKQINEKSLNSFQKFCNTTNNDIKFDCFVKDFTKCNNYKPFEYTYKKLSEERNYLPTIAKMPEDITQHNLGEVFWASNNLKYVLRPNSKVLKLLNKVKKELNFAKLRNEGMIGVHIRHGDVCSPTKFRWMRKCLPLSTYMTYINKISTKYGYKNIFISTDSNTIISEIKQYEKTNNKKGYKFIYNNFNREKYTDSNWIEYRSDINFEDIYIETLIDILLLSETSALVGTYTSNISRVAYMLMIINSAGYKPYASLDTQWCMYNKGGFPC